MSSALTAFETAPPRFSAQEARGLANELFGVEGEATDLAGERDQTFAISDGARRYVLKISNADESAIVLDFEASLLRHIEWVERAIRVPRRIELARNHSPEALENGLGRVHKDGVGHFVRLFEHLDGHAGMPGAGLDDESVNQLGETVGRLALAMRGYFHPAAGRQLLWDVSRVVDVRPLTDRVVPDEHRALISRVINKFEADALPRWPSLRAQIVHGDLTLENVVLGDGGCVSGIIDFGDAVHGSLLLDLASALASVLRRRDGEEALRTARVFLDGYCSRVPLEPVERELLGIVLCTRLASIVIIASWYMQRFPHKAHYFEGSVRESTQLLGELDGIGWEKIDHAFGVPRACGSVMELVNKRKSLLGPALSDLFYAEPVHVASGEGAWLTDADGKRLLDAYNNVAVVGHCHPRVTEAVVAQTRRLNTHARYLYEPLLDLAQRLTDGIRERYGLDTVMIVNSGSEANDLAWRLATTYTEEVGGIVSAEAYHGMTAAVADLSPQQWPPGHRADHVEPFAVGNQDGNQGLSVTRGVELAIRRLADRGMGPAALYVEGGFTSDGILMPPPMDVAEAVGLARAAGALIVADEVQVGHWRTGSHLWSFERDGYVPDFITMGKPMGNGYPVAAMVTRADIAARFANGTYYFSTFGGNPVAARAALTVLEVIEENRLPERVAEVGTSLTAMLSELRQKHAAISDIRGHGTLIGVELRGTDTAAPADMARLVVDGLRQRGVLVGRTGPAFDVLKIRPPLIFTREHATTLVNALDEVLTELERS